MSRLKVDEIVNFTEDGTTVAIQGFSIASGKKFKILGSRTIASAGATGEICWDVSYLYICVATNTWKRIPLTW